MVGQSLPVVALHEATHVAVCEMLGIEIKAVDIEANGIAHTRWETSGPRSAWSAMVTHMAPLVVWDLSPNDLKNALTATQFYFVAATAASDGDAWLGKVATCYEYADAMCFLRAKAGEILARAEQIAPLLEVGWNPPSKWAA
jgi:hypothetical protein